MRDFDAPQYCFDAVIHLAQRFADVATITLAALPANGDTGRDEQRPVDGLNDLERRNRMRGARQPVTAVGAVLRMQQASLRQPLQNLGQRLWRNTEGIGNVFRAGAASSLTSMVGQVLHGHQRVVRFLG
jgi:hypothetical protein